MKTCPKCGSILIPKREKGKVVFYCRKCDKSYNFDKDVKLESKFKESKEEATVIGKSEQEKKLPKTNVICPKCGNNEAYYYVQQTRAADEPPTVFYICTKCNYSWRSFE
ncbi:MAG: transcription factor S [Candidatus Aenigmatarchaeota archaeon]